MCLGKTRFFKKYFYIPCGFFSFFFERMISSLTKQGWYASFCIFQEQRFLSPRASLPTGRSNILSCCPFPSFLPRGENSSPLLCPGVPLPYQRVSASIPAAAESSPPPPPALPPTKGGLHVPPLQRQPKHRHSAALSHSPSSVALPPGGATEPPATGRAARAETFSLVFCFFLNGPPEEPCNGIPLQLSKKEGG